MAEKEERKAGDRHLAAMLRLGLREFREVGNPQVSNIVQPSELGLYGTATPQDVVDNQRLVDREFDDEPSRDELTRGQGQGIQQGRDDPGFYLER